MMSPPNEDIDLVNWWPVRCGCGLAYWLGSWKSLAYVGVQEEDDASLELRNCVCGSTIAQRIDTSFG